MRYKTEKSVADAIKSGKIGGAYLLTGSEPYLISRCRKDLLRAWTGEEESPFSVERLEGEKPDYDRLYAAVTSIPMLGGKKAVVVDGFAADKQNQADLEKLKTILEELPEDTLLLVSAGESGQAAKAKAVVSAFDKMASVVELGPRPAGELAGFVREQAEKRGSAISPALARYIVDSCGTDMVLLEQETAKLSGYAGGGEITRRHVEDLLSPKTEARVFDLSKRILSGDYQGAMEILDTLFYMRESPAAILSVLSMAYTDLYKAKCAKAAGKTVGDLVKDFDYKGKDFRPRSAMGQLSGISARGLSESIRILAHCDRQIKSSRVDDKILLEQAVTRLYACRRA